MISASNEQLQRQLEYALIKPDFHSWWISKIHSGREDTLEEQYAIKFSFKLGKNATETYGMLQTVFGESCMNGASVFELHKRFKEGREYVRDDERCSRSNEVKTPELIGQINDFMNNGRHESIETISAQFDVSVGTALFKSSWWHFQQDNVPVHNSILVTDYLIKMVIRQFLSLPIVKTLLPVTFGYSLSTRTTLEAVVMRQLRRWKRLWRRSLALSHQRTSMGPSGSCWNHITYVWQPKEITSKGTRVLCVWYQ